MRYFKSLGSITKNRELIKVLVRRDITGRYKGSSLGILWSVINPLTMLVVYTYVFSSIFNSRWGGALSQETQSPGEFAIRLFTGLIVFNVFAECIIKAPTLITNNANYVKKIIFPIEILGIVTTTGALYNAMIGTVMILIAKLALGQGISIVILYLPILWIAYTLMLTGFCWTLATIGVIFRDSAQITTSLVNVMMFLSPVFYPTTAIPENVRWLTNANPIGYVIMETRNILLSNSEPDIWLLSKFIMASIVIGEAGLWIIKRNQHKFGDML